MISDLRSLEEHKKINIKENILLNKLNDDFKRSIKIQKILNKNIK